MFGHLVMELCQSLLVTLRFLLFALTHAVKRWIPHNEYDDNQFIFFKITNNKRVKDKDTDTQGLSQLLKQ